MFDLGSDSHLSHCVLQKGEDTQWPWRGEEAQAHGHGENFFSLKSLQGLIL